MKASKIDVRIVIAQRGFVFVGSFVKDGSQCFVRDGYIIRNWGTTAGLGELAVKGPLSRTVLDPIPELELHELTIIATLKCDAVWDEKCSMRL